MIDKTGPDVLCKTKIGDTMFDLGEDFEVYEYDIYIGTLQSL